MSDKAPEIKFEKYRLANGLQVILHQDRKLPVVHVNLWYHVGSKDEKPGRTGFAHLFEHMMFQGSKHADREYLTYMETAGANLREGGVNGTTSFDRTNYFETVPGESFEYALWLESDRMGFLADALTQEKLDNQRDVVKNERRQNYENVPYGKAFLVILENLFPKGHPYSWPVIGSEEDLTAASVHDVQEFFRTFYTPNNCSLVVSGDFDESEAVRLVERHFGPFDPGPPLQRAKLWIPELHGKKRVTVFDRVPQQRLYMAWPTPPYFHPGDAELDLASRLLSQGKNSRLYKTLVYDKQIASDVSAFNYSLEISGIFGIVTTVRPGCSLSEVEETIQEEIRRFAQSGPSQEELQREKAKQEFDFVSGLERIGGFGGKADLLNQYNTFLGSPDFFQKDYDRYQNISPAKILGVVGRYLNTDNRLEVCFEPETSGRPETAQWDRSLAPAIVGQRAFRPPRFHSATADNGLGVIVTERHDLPKVAVGLVLKSGSTADPSNQPGIAWMTAEMLDEGTTSRSALQIQAELDRLGASLGSAAETEISHVSLETLKKNLRPALDLMSDIVLHPSFSNEELERQRKQRLDGILQERNHPQTIARKALRSALFREGHPFGRPTAGTEESIKAMSRHDLETYHRSFWKPNNAAIVFAGDITLEEAVKLSEQTLGQWKPEYLPEVSVPLAEPPESLEFYLVDRQDAPQSQIRIGSIGPGRRIDAYYAIELMNAVLGGSFSSRLNMNLREDKGYTYGVFSGFSYGRQLGAWTCGAAVQTRFTKEAIIEFQKELQEIRAERPVTQAELDNARTNLSRGFAQRFETLDRLVEQVADSVSFELPLTEIENYPSRLEGVSLEQARDAAQRYLNPNRSVVVVVGDLDEIQKGLSELRPAKVAVLDVEGRLLEAIKI